jgi:hypothetical protein
LRRFITARFTGRFFSDRFFRLVQDDEALDKSSYRLGQVRSIDMRVKKTANDRLAKRNGFATPGATFTSYQSCGPLIQRPNNIVP